MDALQVIRRLYQHQRWLTRGLVDAARALSDEHLRRKFEMGPGSVMETLFHLYRAEVLWIGSIEGDSSPPPPPPVASLDELRAAWAGVEGRWDRLLGGVSEARLDADVVKVPTGSTTGQPIVTSLGDVLMHVATHASYHAAQVVNMMRHLGVNPLPPTMLIKMARDEREGT